VDSDPDSNDGLPLRQHAIIVGASGSGKSNTVMSLIVRKIRDKQHLHIIDAKYELGPIFGKQKNVWITKPDYAEAKFDELIAMAEMRQNMFAQASELCGCLVRDYGEYFKVTGLKMPIITLVVEELIVTMGAVKEDKLVKLLVTGRSAGIFVVACSQYLKADILSRKGSVNFSTRVFMGRWDSTTASILFGSLTKAQTEEYQNYTGAPGKAIVEINGELSTKQMPRISEAQLQQYMKP
jgi:DNA segregation ATPase FtsK/SpoIIIE-like protein